MALDQKSMNTKRIIIGLLICGAICTGARAQATAGRSRCFVEAGRLRYGDLYNWADAAPLFSQAEQLYVARGDNQKRPLRSFSVGSDPTDGNNSSAP